MDTDTGALALLVHREGQLSKVSQSNPSSSCNSQSKCSINFDCDYIDLTSSGGMCASTRMNCLILKPSNPQICPALPTTTCK
ncbi:unnamed protein product [Didymodactylos carnosus]|uniref:Uncharacterized protein n=1 Tax=Didymodactylos carnosus TaxID=1234261 RepID=A0A814LI44_9BILA|nr:unnamed protein product [Didymodactylos carnosus]CAF3831660.1 unnamed protein product [Didymodactylos carnosus]